MIEWAKKSLLIEKIVEAWRKQKSLSISLFLFSPMFLFSAYELCLNAKARNRLSRVCEAIDSAYKKDSIFGFIMDKITLKLMSFHHRRNLSILRMEYFEHSDWNLHCETSLIKINALKMVGVAIFVRKLTKLFISVMFGVRVDHWIGA